MKDRHDLIKGVLPLLQRKLPVSREALAQDLVHDVLTDIEMGKRAIGTKRGAYVACYRALIDIMRRRERERKALKLCAPSPTKEDIDLLELTDLVKANATMNGVVDPIKVRIQCMLLLGHTKQKIIDVMGIPRVAFFQHLKAIRQNWRDSLEGENHG